PSTSLPNATAIATISSWPKSATANAAASAPNAIHGRHGVGPSTGPNGRRRGGTKRGGTGGVASDGPGWGAPPGPPAAPGGRSGGMGRGSGPDGGGGALLTPGRLGAGEPRQLAERAHRRDARRRGAVAD